MHLQRRRLELTNLDGVISASEHHRKKPRRSWSTIDFGRAPSLSKWSAIRRMAKWKREAASASRPDSLQGTFCESPNLIRLRLASRTMEDA